MTTGAPGESSSSGVLATARFGVKWAWSDCGLQKLGDGRRQIACVHRLGGCGGVCIDFGKQYNFRPVYTNMGALYQSQGWP